MILVKSAGSESSFGVVSVAYDFGQKADRWSGFGVQSVTYDFWPKAQAAGQALE